MKQAITAWIAAHRPWAHGLAVAAGGAFVTFASDANVRNAVLGQLASHPRISALLTTAASWYLIYLKAKR